jgi:uncharacterized protein (TIGR02453 family)
VLDLTAVLIDEIGKFDSQVRYLQPKDCLFRIYRDTRFSLDKSPYKRHFGTYIAMNGGHRSLFSGYYIHLQPGSCMLSGGIWCADNQGVKRFRSYIDTEYDELFDIMGQPDFKQYFGDHLTCFESLKRPPMGYASDHPAIELLKMKQWLTEHHFDDALLDTPDKLIDHLVNAAHAMMPFSHWCNRGLLDV